MSTLDPELEKPYDPDAEGSTARMRKLFPLVLDWIRRHHETAPGPSTEPVAAPQQPAPAYVPNHHFDVPELKFSDQKGMYSWAKPDGQTVFFTPDKMPADLPGQLRSQIEAVEARTMAPRMEVE